MAAVTNLPQTQWLNTTRIYLVSKFQKPGVQNQYQWSKAKALAGLVPPGGSKKESVSLPFSVSRALFLVFLGSWSSVFTARNVASSNLSLLLLYHLLLCLSVVKSPFVSFL